jgi:hypothetical protein
MFLSFYSFADCGTFYVSNPAELTPTFSRAEKGHGMLPNSYVCIRWLHLPRYAKDRLSSQYLHQMLDQYLGNPVFRCEDLYVERQ